MYPENDTVTYKLREDQVTESYRWQEQRSDEKRRHDENEIERGRIGDALFEQRIRGDSLSLFIFMEG